LNVRDLDSIIFALIVDAKHQI